jgi:hypothetical protein
MARKKEGPRERKIRRGVLKGFKPQTATDRNNQSKQKTGGSGAKKGKKRSGRFAGMTSAEIKAFRVKKGKVDQPATGPTELPEPVSTTTDTQIPSAPEFDYEGALEDMRAEFEERQRLADEKYQKRLAEFELTERTQMDNQARSGQQTEYKLGSPSERMRGGTFGFRRRKNRKLMRGIASTLAAGTGGMLNL